MKDKLCHLGFKTHKVCVAVNSDGILNCFKYDPSTCRCDLASFNDHESASDFIFAPFDSLVYEVHIEERDTSEE